MIHLTVLGSTPAKKNSRKPFVRGNRMMNFPNPVYVKWERDALKQLLGTSPISEYPAVISCTFYVPDNRKRDNSNMLDSIQDMLVKAGILAGDHWQILDVGGLHSEIDRDNPRAEIYLD